MRQHTISFLSDNKSLMLGNCQSRFGPPRNLLPSHPIASVHLHDNVAVSLCPESPEFRCLEQFLWKLDTSRVSNNPASVQFSSWQNKGLEPCLTQQVHTPQKLTMCPIYETSTPSQSAKHPCPGIFAPQRSSQCST